MDVILCLGQNVTRLTRWIVINSGHINSHVQWLGAGELRLLIPPNKATLGITNSKPVRFLLQFGGIGNFNSLSFYSLKGLGYMEGIYSIVSPHWAMPNSVRVRSQSGSYRFFHTLLINILVLPVGTKWLTWNLCGMLFGTHTVFITAILNL